MKALRGVNNELAAQMALEIVGKVHDSGYPVEICKAWIKENSDKLQNVICETVRHYPRSKTDIALHLLQPYLNGPKAKAIYSLCTDTFARDAPERLHEFLRHRLPRIKEAGDDEKTHYRKALCAAIRYGAIDALDDLVELFPDLKPGQQAGLLYDIADITTESNAIRITSFLKHVVDLLSKAKKAKQAEVWDGILKTADLLHRASPDTGREFAQWLIETDYWKQDQITSMYTGMIVGPTISSLLVVYDSLSSVASEDHYIRLLNAGILSNLPEGFSADLMDRILSLEKNLYQDEAKIESLFSIVASIKGVDPAKILRFLEDWPWLDTGVGTPLRRIMEYLAHADPTTTKQWLFEQLALTKGPVGDKLFSSFNIISQMNITVFCPDEVRRLYDIAFASSKAIKQRFAGTVGSIAKIDKGLADEILSRIFNKEGKDCQVAAINSLVHCLDSCPEFALDHGATVLKIATGTNRLGLLHSYLIVFKKLQRGHARTLLLHLDGWFTEEVLQSLGDSKTFGELLSLLKILAEADPRLAFNISKRIPIINKAVAGGLAALYDQVSEHSDEVSLLTDLLESVAVVSRFNQVRMANALRRTLARLDHKLGGRKVVEMVLGVYREISDERALETFFEAALRIPSWTEEDAATLLRDPDLPGSVRSILSTKIMR
jgi:hypothetical protein